jgi:predicted hydrocarbon binding protein
MDTMNQRSREVAIPSRSLKALRTSLRDEAGPGVAVQALQVAGYEAGGDLYPTFARGVGDASAMGGPQFWSRVANFLRERGWGSLHHAAPHPGVGTLSSTDWAEVDESGEDAQPTCTFSSGLLAGFLTAAAGTPVAVLQVGCVSQGDAACVFAFGSEQTVQSLYQLLLDGFPFDDALGRL